MKKIQFKEGDLFFINNIKVGKKFLALKINID